MKELMWIPTQTVKEKKKLRHLGNLNGWVSDDIKKLLLVLLGMEWYSGYFKRIFIF